MEEVLFKAGDEVYFIENFTIKKGYIKKLIYKEDFYTNKGVQFEQRKLENENRVSKELKYLVKTFEDSIEYSGRNIKQEYLSKTKEELLKKLKSTI